MHSFIVLIFPCRLCSGTSRAVSQAANEADETTSSEIEVMKNVSATTKTAGVEIKTNYHYGGTSDFIEVFIDGELRAKIVKDQVHDAYCNAMKHEGIPQGEDVCASTVIEANDCKIKTDVFRRGKKETIAVYKDDKLLCRAGSTIL